MRHDNTWRIFYCAEYFYSDIANTGNRFKMKEYNITCSNSIFYKDCLTTIPFL